MPDNGLANLAASLKREGHDAIVLDFGTVETIKLLYPPEIGARVRPIYRKISEGKRISFAEKAKMLLLNFELERHQKKQLVEMAAGIEKDAREFGADFVGLKLWNGDGFTGSVSIANYLKKRNPRLKIFAGGPHVDLFKELILKKAEDIDVVAYGEGEEIIGRLAEYAIGDRKDLSEVPNVMYREGNGGIRTNAGQLIENLDSLPMPIYDENVYPSMAGNQKIKIITLDESRGCPFGCYFCAQPAKSGTRTRTKSPARIADEIQTLAEKLGIRAFRYAGSNTPGKLMLDVARILKERRLNVGYSSFAEANLLNDPALIKELRESGLVSIFFGMESGSQRLLDSVHKCLGLNVLAKALKASKEAGIFTVASLIYPLPGESPATREETLRFLSETMPDSVPVQFPGLYPGTPWFANPEKFGFSVNLKMYPGKVIDYKIKLLFPPSLWKNPGYRIDGKKFKQFSKETMMIIRDIEKLGILTGFSDDQFLMATLTEMKPRQFRDENRGFYFEGDFEQIRGMVEEINENIKDFDPQSKRF